MEKKKKSPRKATAPKIKDLDIQQRKLAIIKQKQCDTIALHIVSKLIEGCIEEDVFLQSLKYLNQCHFQDIVEERAITKLCGYPVCGNVIQNMPSKKFHISTKSNKIYDITQRKNYCSNFCYKAGSYIKEQMLTSPLWFRDKEEIPEFHLLPRYVPGVPGEEIDQGILKLEVEADQKDQNFTSISKFTQDMVNEIPENICNVLDKEENNYQTEDFKKEANKEPNVEPEIKEEPNKSEIDFNMIYGPNLADILRENADYFEKKTGNENNSNLSATYTTKTDKKADNANLDKKSSFTVSHNRIMQEEKKSHYIEVEPSTSVSETCKIGFDRTVINTKSKSILKNAKNKNLKRKRVSFSEENSVQEIEKLENKVDKKSFKKPEQSKTEENNGRKYKNTNLIGVVQERPNIYRIMNKTINREANNEERVDISTSDENYQEKQDKSKENISKFAKARLSKKQFPKKFKLDLKSELENCVSQWFTFDTILFLFGEEQVENILTEKTFKQFLNKKKNLELDEKKQKQYEEICKRLNLMDLAEHKFDESVTGKKRRPLPRYEDLRQNAENLDLRVQAFYSGCYEMCEEEVETDTESVKDDEEDNTVKGAPAVLPLIDNKDVMATRRKIFLSSISRTISNICEIIQGSPNKLLSEIKHLINTFEFTASNIVFRANEWQFITWFLIVILSIRNPGLNESLQSTEGTIFSSAVKKEFGLQDDYFTELITKLNIQDLLDQCMRKDCIT